MFRDVEECAASAVSSFYLSSDSWFEKREFPPLGDSFLTVEPCFAGCKQITNIHKRSKSWSHSSSLSSRESSQEISRPQYMPGVSDNELCVLPSMDFQPAKAQEEQRLPHGSQIFPPQAYEPGPVIRQDLPLPVELNNLIGQPQKDEVPLPVELNNLIGQPQKDEAPVLQLHQILQSDADFQMLPCAASADSECSLDHALADDSATPRVQPSYQSTGSCQMLLHKLEASGMPPEIARSIIGGDANHTPLLSCHQYACQADPISLQADAITSKLDESQEAPEETRQDSISKTCEDVPEGYTLMIRNLPAWVTTNQLVSEIKDIGLGTSLQCLYMPQTFQKCWQQNNSYAFANFDSHGAAARLQSEWHLQDVFGKGKFKGEKGDAKCKNGRRTLNITLANVQGLRENLSRWRTSKTSRIKNDTFRPMLFNKARGL